MQNENNKNETLKESKTSPWLDWAVKLQAIAQAGLTYGKDVYDRERYEQIRDIAAEMISLHSGISKEKVAVFRSSREIKTSVSLFFNY